MKSALAAFVVALFGTTAAWAAAPLTASTENALSAPTNKQAYYKDGKLTATGLWFKDKEIMVVEYFENDVRVRQSSYREEGVEVVLYKSDGTRYLQVWTRESEGRVGGKEYRLTGLSKYDDSGKLKHAFALSKDGKSVTDATQVDPELLKEPNSKEDPFAPSEVELR
ncbi:MAG: hypothetical protein K2W82_18090 [Candidatus Obscuribacterales bacterium]|nr:hypothetical protein [Candidatus Obscuribacterales bacterium]